MPVLLFRSTACQHLQFCALLIHICELDQTWARMTTWILGSPFSSHCSLNICELHAILISVYVRRLKDAKGTMCMFWHLLAKFGKCVLTSYKIPIHHPFSRHLNLLLVGKNRGLVGSILIYLLVGLNMGKMNQLVGNILGHPCNIYSF